MDARPIRLALAPVSLLGAGLGEQPRRERGVGHLVSKRPAQAGSLKASDRRADRRWGYPNPTGDLTGRYATNELQPKHFAHMAHGRSLCWHPVSPWEGQRSAPDSAGRGTRPRARSSRNAGRHHLGTVGEIISEWWAASSRNRGRLPLGIRTL